MNNITLGRYIPYDTIIHRLDPRTKIVAMILLLVCVFLPIGYIGFATLLVLVFALLKVAKIKISSVYKSLKPMWFMMIFILIINMFLIQEGDVLFTLFNRPFYTKAFTQTLMIIIRLVLMISVTTVLTATTKPLDLTYGLEFFMTPLKVIKFPAHEIAMTISIALRFIPTILEETQKIMKAQASRGVDLQEGSLKEKISAIISLIIPLFISAFQRSEELANAMEARGYNPSAKRTRYRTLKFTMKDVFSLLVSILVLGVCITFSNFPNLLEQLLGWSYLF
jgi:energy-coupling factor transport system permease protein